MLRTLPSEFSTLIAFLGLSVTSWPASVGRMSFGGTWRRPGPSRKGFVGCDGMYSGSMWSPGRTKTGSEDMPPAVSATLMFKIELALRALSSFPSKVLEGPAKVELLGERDSKGKGGVGVCGWWRI